MDNACNKTWIGFQDMDASTKISQDLDELFANDIWFIWQHGHLHTTEQKLIRGIIPQSRKETRKILGTNLKIYNHGSRTISYIKHFLDFLTELRPP